MIHFTSHTIAGIEAGEDSLLEPYLKTYRRYRNIGKRYVKSRGYCVSKSNPERGSEPELWDIEGAAVQKAQGTNSIAAARAAHAFASRLQAATLRMLIVEYDSVFGKHGSAPPSVADGVSVELLSSLIDQGLTLAVISRRGKRMSDQLRSAFSRARHCAIWVCPYGGSVVERLDCPNQIPRNDEMCEQVWEDLSAILPENEASKNEHLSAGGQLALRLRHPALADRLAHLLREVVSRRNLHCTQLALTPDRSSVFLVLRGDITKDILLQSGRFSSSEVLRIGTFGEECGLDYCLLSEGLALSCGTVSLSLCAGWNLCPNRSNLRESAHRYLSAIRASKKGLAFGLS
jgi:hypothetical protein